MQVLSCQVLCDAQPVFLMRFQWRAVGHRSPHPTPSVGQNGFGPLCRRVWAAGLSRVSRFVLSLLWCCGGRTNDGWGVHGLFGVPVSSNQTRPNATTSLPRASQPVTRRHPSFSSFPPDITPRLLGPGVLVIVIQCAPVLTSARQPPNVPRECALVKGALHCSLTPAGGVIPEASSTLPGKARQPIDARALPWHWGISCLPSCPAPALPSLNSSSSSGSSRTRAALRG